MVLLFFCRRYLTYFGVCFFLFPSRWEILVFSSCCSSSSMLLWEWSSLANWVSHQQEKNKTKTHTHTAPHTLPEKVFESKHHYYSHDLRQISPLFLYPPFLFWPRKDHICMIPFIYIIASSMDSLCPTHFAWVCVGKVLEKRKKGLLGRWNEKQLSDKEVAFGEMLWSSATRWE